MSGPEKLQERLDALGWGNAEAATRLGVAETTVWRWRNAKRTPEGKNLMKLRDVLGLDPGIWHTTEQQPSQ